MSKGASLLFASYIYSIDEESIMVFFIAISPFLYKLYEYIPEATGSSVTIIGITIDSHGFADVSTFIWFMMGKIVPLYLLIFWFLTVKNWYYNR